jgi:hypothetical protein
MDSWAAKFADPASRTQTWGPLIDKKKLPSQKHLMSQSPKPVILGRPSEIIET